MEVCKEHFISITEGIACAPLNLKRKKLRKVKAPVMCSRDKIQ